MMRRYETLILTVPEVTQDEAKDLERRLDKLVKKADGSVILFDKWGKYKLAYPVKKNDYGVYFLLRFEVPENSSALRDIDQLFKVKLRDLVMRFMTSVIDADAGLSYERPPSLEDTPTRDVGTFIKENKMEGLMPKKGRGAKKESAQADSTDESKQEAGDQSKSDDSEAAAESKQE